VVAVIVLSLLKNEGKYNLLRCFSRIIIRRRRFGERMMRGDGAWVSFTAYKQNAKVFNWKLHSLRPKMCECRNQKSKPSAVLILKELFIIHFSSKANSQTHCLVYKWKIIFWSTRSDFQSISQSNNIKNFAFHHLTQNTAKKISPVLSFVIGTFDRNFVKLVFLT
jgi:hypothetical protein